MILNRLSLLLAERQLKITNVANATKISRTTLTALMKNESKMIQLETINSLCIFLEIDPNDFFDFIPYNFSYHFDHDDELLYDPKEGPITYKANGFVNVLDPVNGNFDFEYTGEISDLGGAISVYLEPVNSDIENVAQSFFNGISKSFVTQIEKDFSEYILNIITEEFGSPEYACDVKINLTNMKNK
ncbi:helix-turn-helix domain-containing protein [Vagococcus fluvialis]|uniref:helix-turn-helix domain-containing protein n=1 Tax=Vagococcus fluvialis TaxID=2738 RepID=UPI003B595E39